MTVLLDSARVSDARTAATLGFVRGITTNPTLMAREMAEPLTHLGHLLEAFPCGPVCHQPTGASAAELCREARTAVGLYPDHIIIKLPATAEGVRAAAELCEEGVPCGLTAVYSPAQALLAHETGCIWAIPYVDRAARQSPGEPPLVPALAALLRRLESETRILAASIKSAAQATDAITHGADDITASLEVLQSLAVHPLTESAMEEFARATPSSS